MSDPRHRYPLQQLAHGGDFIGFGLDQLAAAIILTGTGWVSVTTPAPCA